MDFENHSGDGKGLGERLFEEEFLKAAGKDQKKDSKYEPNTPLYDGSFEHKKNEPHQSSKKEVENSQAENFKPEADSSRSKSSLRLKYEAEVLSFIKTHGELEDIRRKLGLSKRRMAQLLMVDPSAWTRWTSQDGEAPPHIYRALQWYLILQEKHPELKSSLWLNFVNTPSMSRHEVENIKKEVLQWIKSQEDLLLKENSMQKTNSLPGETNLQSNQSVRAEKATFQMVEDMRDLRKKLHQAEKKNRLLMIGLGALIFLLLFSIF